MTIHSRAQHRASPRRIGWTGPADRNAVHAVCAAFAGAVLFVLAQPSYGSEQRSQRAELCAFLDKVVASIAENPPFASVRFQDAPGGASCQVGGSDRHEAMGLSNAAWHGYKAIADSWACIWRDARLQNFKPRLKGIKSKKKNALKLSERKQDKIHQDILDAIRRREFGALYDRLDAEQDRLNAERKRIREEYSSRENRLRDEFGESRRALVARARKFVSSVRECVRTEGIRGAWRPFDEEELDIYKGHFISGVWSTSSDTMAKITISEDTEDGLVALEIWKWNGK